MKRILYSICASLLFIISTHGHEAMAGNNDVKAIEMEVGAGFSIAPATKAGMHVLGELRWNIPHCGADLGIQAASGSYMKDNDVDIRMPVLATLFADWNFRGYRKASPFIGIGAGYCHASATGLHTESSTSDSALITPRIGIELFSHIRITAEYRITLNSDISHIGISLGWAFGGGYRR